MKAMHALLLFFLVCPLAAVSGRTLHEKASIEVQSILLTNREAHRIQSVPSQDDDVDKIMDGESAPPGRFPYMCSLRDHKDEDPFCAGTLIHPQLVLTAAHCLRSISRADPPTIICGDFAPSENNGTDIRTVRDFAQHPRWNLPKKYANDIGIIWLDEPAKNTPVVQVVTEGQWKTVAEAKPKLWGAGWGRTAPYETSISTPPRAHVLQQFKAPLMDTAMCNSIEIYNGDMDPASEICVGDSQSGPSTCKGDSGGPMLYIPEGKLDDASAHVQVGVVSWSGSSCGTAREPDVHTKVAAFHSWIQQAIAEIESTVAFKDDDFDG